MTNIRVLPQPLPVESRPPAPEEAAFANTEAPGLPRVQADGEPIGAPLEEIRADLLRHGERLAGQIAEPGASFVRDAIRVLENQICKIAVVGQVKSGQGAFIGALAEKAGLLPAELSPWTTAVTRLHFGWAGAPSGVAAECQLFEAADWERLAAGSGRVRELTSQLVPGFEPELLERQIDAMRQRAEQRFGEGFEAQLGAKHSHESLAPDLLARYLSPGSSAAMTGDGPGQFADITRSVELYLPPGAFRFPATVIATPGINDPFLVRDEITRLAIEGADLHIVVLNARQPLTTADLALLRILRGLHKERIIVFVDHVDELRDPAAETRSIVGQVRQTLAREFPSLDIPVVAGSARWASLALSPASLEDRQALTPAVLAYAKHKGAIRPVELKGGAPGGPAEDVSTGHLARTLSICSGYPELRRALTGLLMRSHSAHLIKQIATYFAELSQINEAGVREDMVKHAITSETVIERTAESERELQQAQSELVRIQAVASELTRKLNALQSLIGEIVAEQRTNLYEGLANILEGFARREGDNLVLAFEQGRARRNWPCETAALRQLIEKAIEQVEETAGARFAGSGLNVFPAIREAILRKFPDLVLPPAPSSWRDPADARHLVGVPISDVVAIDLGASGPLVGWARSRSPAEHAAELERLLVQELMPAVDEAMRLGMGELQRQASLISERCTSISVAVIESLRRQSEGYIARARELLDARDNRPTEEIAQAERLAGLRERLAVAEALSRRLADLNSRCGTAIA